MSKRVMVIDDSKTMRDMAFQLLKGEGFEVILAEDGVEGLKLSDDGSYDLFISDINMPNMDGYTLISKLRENPKFNSVPILVMTTETDIACKERGKAVGATGWITKPFEPKPLIDVIRRVCR
jgi:two-component system chemotaxis response regulator CheY